MRCSAAWTMGWRRPAPRVQGSDAVLVAEALGLNESVVRRARELAPSGSNAEMGESIDE